MIKLNKNLFIKLQSIKIKWLNKKQIIKKYLPDIKPKSLCRSKT